tara:strand:- start:104 stop:460 length:357 start_codon:yes stop_codon:yes gene_type:complete
MNKQFETIEEMLDMKNMFVSPREIKLYETDYVLVDKDYNPVDGLDICLAEESVYDEFTQGTYTEEEIENKMKTLKKEGEVLIDVDDTLCNWKWVSMTRLPNKIQKMYLDFYRKGGSNE